MYVNAARIVRLKLGDYY